MGDPGLKGTRQYRVTQTTSHTDTDQRRQRSACAHGSGDRSCLRRCASKQAGTRAWPAESTKTVTRKNERDTERERGRDRERDAEDNDDDDDDSDCERCVR